MPHLTGRVLGHSAVNGAAGILGRQRLNHCLQHLVFWNGRGINPPRALAAGRAGHRSSSHHGHQASLAEGVAAYKCPRQADRLVANGTFERLLHGGICTARIIQAPDAPFKSTNITSSSKWLAMLTSRPVNCMSEDHLPSGGIQSRRKTVGLGEFLYNFPPPVPVVPLNWTKK